MTKQENNKQEENTKKSKSTININAPYKFTKDELKDLGIELANECSNKHEIEEELSGVKKEFKGRLDGSQQKIDELTQKLQKGEEDRVYECYETKDYTKFEKVYTNAKTKEVVKRVPFTAEDHQIELEDSVEA